MSRFMAVLLAAAACRPGEVTTVAQDTTPLAKYLTPELAASLTPSGLLPAAPATPSARIDEIDEARARALATIAARQLVPGLLPALQRQRAARVDVGQLRLCGRVFYVNTPFELPDDAARLPRYALNWYGAAWLANLCGPGTTSRCRWRFPPSPTCRS